METHIISLEGRGYDDGFRATMTTYTYRTTAALYDARAKAFDALDRSKVLPGSYAYGGYQGAIDALDELIWGLENR